MIDEVCKFHGLSQDFHSAGYYVSENGKRFTEELRRLITNGRVVGVPAIHGSGKTTTLGRIRRDLQKHKDFLVSTSLAVEKGRVSVTTLIDALFADLLSEDDPKPPSKIEYRSRYLRDLIIRHNKTVVLFVDEAQDLHHKTLLGLKNLREVVEESGVRFSIVLIGLPRLAINLRRSALEAIGSRLTVLPFNGIKGEETEFLRWLLEDCVKNKTSAKNIFTDDARAVLVDRLTTPLQVIHYAWRTLAEAHRVAEKPVDAELVEAVLAPDLDALEARLARQGYDEKEIARVLDLRPKEVRSFLRGKLEAERTQELSDELLKLGIVV